MSKILLLSDPILATSLILSYDRNRKPSPMHCFSMVRGGQQSTIVPPILYPLSYAPYCHAFMHIFYTIFPLRWLVAWINMGSMQTPFPCQLPRFPNHIICLLSLVGRCPNKRLGSRFVNYVLASQSTKQATIQVYGCELDDGENKKHITSICALVSSPPIEHQATNMLQQSCASLVLVCHFGIGIVYLSHNRPEQMTNSDVLNSTRSISLPLLISYPVFFPLSGLTPILSRLPERDVATSWCTS